MCNEGKLKYLAPLERRGFFESVISINISSRWDGKPNNPL